MSQANLMKSDTRDVIVEASGKSKEEAYGNVFRILRKKIYEEVNGLILHMEPIAVYEIDEEVKEYTERFLFLFMPREKKEYKLKVKITVSVKYMET